MPIARLRAVFALIATVLCAFAGAASASVPAPTMAAVATTASSITCDVSRDGRKLGPTYVTSLSVSGVTCATGVAVVRAYYHCRVASSGVRGTCHSLVLGYRCSEHRQGIKIQFDAKVTCTRGARKVVHTYVQDT